MSDLMDVRIRVISKAVNSGDNNLNKFWHLISRTAYENKQIEDLITDILQKLNINDLEITANSKLYLDDVELLYNEPIKILRDGELVTLAFQQKLKEESITNCKRKKRSTSNKTFEETQQTMLLQEASNNTIIEDRHIPNLEQNIEINEKIGISTEILLEKTENVNTKKNKCRSNSSLQNVIGGIGYTLSSISMNGESLPSPVTTTPKRIVFKNEERENMGENKPTSFFNYVLPNNGSLEQNKYEAYKSITKFPKKKYQIAFRHLALGEDYSPQITGYKVGKIIKTDKKQKKITIMLEDNSIQKKLQPGKFDLVNEEGEIIDPVNENIIELDWIDVIQPKLISKH